MTQKPSIVASATMFAILLQPAGLPTITAAQEYLPQPVPEHEILAEDVGIWDAETKFWMEPDGEPTAGKAVETNTMIGQMWLLSELKSEFGGVPFVGRGQFGYDPALKKYVGTWIDSMVPYMYTMEGTFDQQTKTLTMMSTGRDPQSGKPQTTKNITKHIDADTKTFEILAPVAGQAGQWWKMMEISYKRRK